jgi:quinol monooxygenase YgiN
MTEKNITVMAKFKAKPGMETELEKIMKELANEARNDPGCLKFEVLQAKDDSVHFMYREVWASQKDIENHLAMSYLPVYREKRAPFLDGDPEVNSWIVIES